MARVVKDADVRRKEILDTALSLFEREGFERTSIDQITAEVGVAKGTFYHYFSSKQDLLEQLVTEWAETLFTHVEAELAGMDGDALLRLRSLFLLGGNLKLEQRETSETFGRSLYTDENLRLRHALTAKWFERLRTILVPIVDEGMRDATFRVAEAPGTATALAALWFGWSDNQVERALAALDDPVAMHEIASEVGALETGMERILGLAEGTLMLGLDRMLEQYAEGR